MINRFPREYVLVELCAHVEQTLLCSFSYFPICVIVFSSEFKRKNEFRRISETLRLHQQQSSMRSTSMMLPGQNAQTSAQPVDPLTRILETRNHQLRVASELGLWSVAFQTVDETYQLLAKKRPTHTQLINYYSNLAKILFMSSNPQQRQLFHAACVLKHSNLVPAAADQAVLAVLAATVSDSLLGSLMSDSAATATETQEATDQTSSFVGFDKTARLVTLTGTGAVPTAESLLSELIAKDLVSNASGTVREIYTLFQSKEAGSINAKLPALLAALPTDLVQYVPALRRAALVKVTKDMQRMYSCMRMDKFELLTKGLLPLEESIKLLGQLKRIDQIEVCIDMQSKTIAFTSAVSSSVSSGLGALECAVSVISRSAAALRNKAQEASILGQAEELLFDEDAFFTKLEADRRRCESRRNASDARKDAIEQDQVRKAQELADQIQKAEEERLEADAKARAAEQARKEQEARKREDLLVKAKAIVEKIVAVGGTGPGTDDELVKLGLEKLEQMLKDQVAKERQDRISKRRNEARRLEHTARLIREAENERTLQWRETVHASDLGEFEQMAAEKADEWNKAAAQKKASVDALMPFADILSEWKGKQTAEFEKKVAARAEERRLKLAMKTAAMAGSSNRDSGDVDPAESEVAPISNMSRDEFKEMAKSLPSWKDSATASPPIDD
jgi:hypothetical protein